MNQKFHYQFEVIGTKWVIDCLDAPESTTEEVLFNKIKNLIDEYDKTYSRFRDDSLISLISREEGKYRLPANSRELLSIYSNLYKITGGLFTPLIGSVLTEAGYDKDYSFKSKTVNIPESFDEVVQYRYPNLVVSKPVLLDFGAAGKGHLVDIVGQLLTSEGVNNYCVDAGGDILYMDERSSSLKVGLEHPENSSQVIGIVNIVNNSICASSGNRRAWGDYHHIINPNTLSSPKDVLSTWVVAEEAIKADALATCLFLVPPDKLLNQYEFEYFVLYPDFTFEKSSGFDAEIFIA